MDAIKEREETRERTWENFGNTLELLLNLRFAIDVSIEAIYERDRLKADRDYWKEQYHEALRDSIRHGETMMGHLLTATLEGKIGSCPKCGATNPEHNTNHD